MNPGKSPSGCPVIKIQGETLPEVWEKSLIECWKRGIPIETEYDKSGDPPSRDCSMVMEVLFPFKEPRLHRAIPAGLADLEVYRQEVVLGIHDDWIKPEEGKWEYTYHERLFDYRVQGKSINQIEHVIGKLSEAPHTRRAQAITWKVWEDAHIRDPACFVAGTRIATPDGSRRVEEIKDGDKVLSYDFVKGKLVTSIATGCFHKKARNLTALIILNETILTLTQDHRVWSRNRTDDGQWRRAKDLTPGMRLLTLGESFPGRPTWNPLAKVHNLSGEELVYDFEVDHPDHTIISEDVLTHNCLQRCWFRIFGENLQLNVHLRSNDAFKAAFMNMFAFTDLQRMVAERVSQKIGRKIKVGKYVHIADSYHIYGSYYKDFRGFLETLRKRSFGERTWSTSFAEPFFEEARRKLKKEKKNKTA